MTPAALVPGALADRLHQPGTGQAERGSHFFRIVEPAIEDGWCRTGSGRRFKIEKGGLLRQFKAFKGREKVDYRISGRLVTGSFGGIDFDQTGEVELPKGLGEAGGGKGPAEKF